MELVTMMLGQSIPIVEFPIREGTVELSRVQLVRDTTENNLIEIMRMKFLINKLGLSWVKLSLS